MTPTPELRFVERLVPIDAHTGKTVRVLQQKWVGTVHRPNTGMDMPVWEWRDVPLVKEETK